MSATLVYTTNLQAGLGLVGETKALLEIWQSGMSVSQLNQKALDSGRFPQMTARRLRNLVAEGFAPRYLVDSGTPARHLKRMISHLTTAELNQMLLLFTSRVQAILADFIRNVYWSRYTRGYSEITNADAKSFVEEAIREGKTSERWSASTIQRVGTYLTRCCADFGLLDSGGRSARRILPFRISDKAATYLAYDLHLKGLGDNAVLNHEDWSLFGLTKFDVLELMKRLSLRGLMVVQAAGEVVRLNWKFQNMESVCDVLTQG